MLNIDKHGFRGLQREVITTISNYEKKNWKRRKTFFLHAEKGFGKTHIGIGLIFGYKRTLPVLLCAQNLTIQNWISHFQNELGEEVYDENSNDSLILNVLNDKHMKYIRDYGIPESCKVVLAVPLQVVRYLTNEKFSLVIIDEPQAIKVADSRKVLNNLKYEFRVLLSGSSSDIIDKLFAFDKMYTVDIEKHYEIGKKEGWHKDKVYYFDYLITEKENMFGKAYSHVRLFFQENHTKGVVYIEIIDDVKSFAKYCENLGGFNVHKYMLTGGKDILEEFHEDKEDSLLIINQKTDSAIDLKCSFMIILGIGKYKADRYEQMISRPNRSNNPHHEIYIRMIMEPNMVIKGLYYEMYRRTVKTNNTTRMPLGGPKFFEQLSFIITLAGWSMTDIELGDLANLVIQLERLKEETKLPTSKVLPKYTPPRIGFYDY